jgi:hypothetical protein
LVEKFKNVTPTPEPIPDDDRKVLALNEKDVKVHSTKSLDQLVIDFKTACPATAKVAACSDNLVLIVVADTEAAAADQIAFKTVCKVEPPSDDSGDSGLFSSRTNRILVLFGFAIASLYFKA